MKEKIFNAILLFSKNYGRTKVLLLYLTIVAAFVSSALWSIDLSTKDGGFLHFAFVPTSISAVSLIALVIITLPVCQYLWGGNGNELHIKGNDVIEKYYIPFFENAFQKLDLENYSVWSSYISIQGTLLISNKQYENLHAVRDMMNRAVEHEGQEMLDGLIKNLGLVIEDLIYVMDSHLVMRGDDQLTFKRFYKYPYPNPHYDENLDKYMKIVRLISDLTFEMTRVLNLILDIIREHKIGFMVEVGSLFIDESRGRSFKYRKDEISKSPYPGLQEFLKVRSLRDFHMDDCTDIDLRNL